MPSIKFSKNSVVYGNPNKVVPSQSFSYFSQERRLFRRTFMTESVETKLEKKWAQDTTSSALVDKMSMFQTQRELR